MAAAKFPKNINALKEARRALAAETLEILEKGQYECQGQKISIGEKLQICRDTTALYSLNDSFSPSTGNAPVISIENETTGAAILRLQKNKPLCALNFASAKSPGGGFLRGAIAQEEDLALSSGLFASLSKANKFYEEQTKFGSALYLDLAILSLNVPFFRDTNWTFTPPVACSIITCAAPNTAALRENAPKSLPHVEGALERRTCLILKLARTTRTHTLILGAWGCGVFGNDPHTVAEIFKKGIAAHGKGIAQIHFALYDTSPDQKTYKAFEQTLNQKKP